MADPSSMQEVGNMVCLAFILSVAQWLENPTGVRKVLGSNPVC